MIVGCLGGFHFIVDSISEISVIAPVLTTLLMFKQAILKPRLAGKELDILEGPELPEWTSLSTNSGNVWETRVRIRKSVRSHKIYKVLLQ